MFVGCFDDEFAMESNAFFDDIKSGRFILVISTILLRELDRAPEHVQRVLVDLPAESIEIVEYADEIRLLRDAYLEAGVVGSQAKSDAEHVAYASVAEADFVVSWNFKHIVHFDRISGYQAVNMLNGYRTINIYSPREVVDL